MRVMENPFKNPEAPPNMADLEDYLGPSRFRVYATISKELTDLGLELSATWSDPTASWQFEYRYNDTPLFNMIWGVDYFYALIDLTAKDYQRIMGQKSKLSQDAIDMMQKHPPIRNMTTVHVEANLEKISDQEAFFDLVPVLQGVLA
ncbi:DUF3788 family protein [Candidatus Neomarinimicrobiota bacterium]